MACSGCSKRRTVLKGVVNRPKVPQPQQRPSNAAKRLGVVAQHLLRDVRRGVRGR